jgi:hypothetical protein
MRPPRSVLPGLPVLFLLGCGADTAGDASPEYDLVTDVQGLMASIVEPAADVYWDAVGTIMDEDGVHDFRPETDEEWEAVRHAAFVVAESGNLLMMEGRAVDRGPWMGFSRDLVRVGRQAIAAAEARDPDAVFEAGGEVYLVCSECHASYAIETLRPNDARADSAGAAATDGAGDASTDSADSSGN